MADKVSGAPCGTGSHASTEPANGLRPSGFDPSREVFGIECEHHYGITTHPLPEDGDIGREVYRLMREAWHPPRDDHGGLHDDDHTWDVDLADNPDWWSRVNIIKNDNSPLFVFNPWRIADGPGAPWFDQKFRVATRGLIDREVADKLSWADRWEREAAEQRDTIRGRKARAKYTSLARMARSDANMIRSRWPEYDGTPRSGWQENMHRKDDPRRDSRPSPEGRRPERAP